MVSATRHDFNAFVRSFVRSLVRSFVRSSVRVTRLSRLSERALLRVLVAFPNVHY